MPSKLRASIMTVTAVVLTCIAVLSVSTSTAYPRPDVDMNDLSFYPKSEDMTPYPQTSSRSVRNVIFLIGDGMGLNQVMLARLKAVGLEGRLYLERLPVSGLARTHSSDNLVTDSAASGTALACGIKTKNGMIGVAPDRKAYRSLLEAAQAQGMATGLVVTSTISHATPASFGAHVRSRSDEAGIAEQLLSNKVDLLLGGGRKFFLPRSVRGGARRDRRNLMADANEAGYTLVSTTEGLQAVEDLPVLGLFQLDALTTAPPEPSLATLTEKAIDLLRDKRKGWFVHKRGFFLMVEGSQIDWACHDNDALHCVWQTLHFDLAVKAAVEFALADGRTLVVVTADHETGGLTIPGGSLDGSEVKVEWSTKGHSGSPVPVYAFGPGAERFAGVYDNTELSAKIAQLMRIEPWPQPIEEEEQAQPQSRLDEDDGDILAEVDWPRLQTAQYVN
ncbi:MAG: alkaline phosphatase [Sedimentisphaerales bacterium]|nr:alkaline phosphatase [Sedimentisphaerales bacterium]